MGVSAFGKNLDILKFLPSTTKYAEVHLVQPMHHLGEQEAATVLAQSAIGLLLMLIII